MVTATANPVDNNAGNDLPGNNATDTDDAEVDPVLLTLAKTVYAGQNSGASCPGSELITVDLNTAITYCFVVTNTGDTYLTPSSSATRRWGFRRPSSWMWQETVSPLPPTKRRRSTTKTTATQAFINTADATGHRPIRTAIRLRQRRHLTAG
ncbi:MAG: hypothetical protein R3A10_16160 [Caldilineaceae bacterium]